MVELREEHEVDGFALMEHNHLVTPSECDLEELGREYGLLILAGVEVDTHWGHILAFGMTEELWDSIQEPGKRRWDPAVLAREVVAIGGIMVPAHPFRFPIGVGARAENLPGIRAIEGINGANEPGENAAARAYAAKRGLAMTGGSDGHYLSELAGGLTRLERPVTTMAELVAEIKGKRCEPLTLEQARRG